MIYKELNDGSDQVSRLGFGMWTLSTAGWGSRNTGDGILLLREAFDLGINLFDTVDSYGKGYSEELLHEALGVVRKEIVISTKVGLDFYSSDLNRLGEPEKNFDPDYIIYACEQSLRRLQTDYIDMFHIHYPELNDVERDDVFEAIDRLKEDGKIIRWGASIRDHGRSGDVAEILLDDRELDVLHLPYNLIEREPLKSLESRLSNFRTDVLVRRPHCFGMLNGLLDVEDLETEDYQNDGEKNKMPESISRVISPARNVVRLCRSYDLDPGRVAIQFILSSPSVSSILPNILDHESLYFYSHYFSGDEVTAELPADLINSLEEFQLSPL